jgi:PAS domain S-box-containing protein
MDNEAYKTLIRLSPFGFAYHQIVLESGRPIDYRFLEVNEAFEKLTGLSAAQIIGKTVKEIIPGIADGKFNWIEAYGELALNGGTKSFESYSSPLKRWYKVLAYSPEKNYFATLFSDITAEKEETRLKNSLFLESLLANTPAVLYAFNIKNGMPAISYISENIKNVLGYPADDFVINNKNWASCVHPDDLERLNRIRQNYASTQSVGRELYEEYRFKDKNGIYRWLADHQKVITDPDGNLETVGAFLDITDRKNALEAIENETKLRQIIDNIDSVVWLRSANRKEMLYISPAYTELFGKTRSSLYENPASFTQAIHPEDKERVNNAYAEFLQSGVFKQEYRIVRPDGNIRWIDSQSFPVKNEIGEIVRYAGIVKNITAEKEAELTGLKLKSIRNQLDPHFTFNAFNAIASYFLKENDTLSYKNFARFSKLLRGSMIYSDKIYRSIGEEIEMTAHYLEIEKFRFRDKFDYSIHYDNSLNLLLPVPRMIIQAYAETAIAISLMHRTEKGLLSIEIKWHKNYLAIIITDNGIGMNKAMKFNQNAHSESLKLMNEFISVINSMSISKVVVNINDLQQNSEITGTKVDIKIPSDVNYDRLGNVFSV